MTTAIITLYHLVAKLYMMSLKYYALSHANLCVHSCKNFNNPMCEIILQSTKKMKCSGLGNDGIESFLFFSLLNANKLTEKKINTQS